MAETVTLRIVVTNPLPNVWCGVQEGHGSAGMPYQVVESPGAALQWDLNVPLRNGKPGGPFIQKDSKGSFVYLVWGTLAGQTGTDVTRRAKIYLPAAPDFPGEHPVWTYEMNGTGKDGGPTCATVKPVRDWQPA